MCEFNKENYFTGQKDLGKIKHNGVACYIFNGSFGEQVFILNEMISQPQIK